MNEEINITIGEKDGIKLSLRARRTMDGNIMVQDHDDLLIIINPNDKIIAAYPKEIPSDNVYEAQDRMFKFLVKKGIISPDSVFGGNIYSSMQSEYLDANDGANTTQLVLFNIGKWINEEKPYLEMRDEFEEKGVKLLTNPDDEDSTELGEIPQEAEKGSIDKNRKKALAGYGFFE